MSAGVILWFNRSQGYGFIGMSDGSQVYFHEAGVDSRIGVESIESGAKVEFDLIRTSMGLEATNIRSTAAIYI